MGTQKKVILAGSQKAAHSAGASPIINRDELITVTLRIRRKKSIEAQLKTTGYITHESYEKEYGASQADVNKVKTFASEYHLITVETNLARRSVILSGSIINMENAFGVTLSASTDADGNQIRVREGSIYIPAELKDIIEGVFGLDNRPAARPMFKVCARDGHNISHAAAPQAFTPDQLANIYGFPQGFDGAGQTIAILELGGGFRADDITTYFQNLGLKVPVVQALLVDGVNNSPTTSDSADGEVMLDIEVAGAVAPAANIAVYFCPNTDQGFLDGITTAIHDTTNKPSVLSISWGSAEVSWTEQSLNSFNEAFKAASVPWCYYLRGSR